ncbi:MAG: hypothetical protein ABI629_18935 [bacterium]
MQRITISPAAGPTVSGQFRKRFVAGFPFSILYCAAAPEQILIISSRASASATGLLAPPSRVVLTKTSGAADRRRTATLRCSIQVCRGLDRYVPAELRLTARLLAVRNQSDPQQRNSLAA